MKTVKTDIYKSLKKNTAITRIVVICSTLLCGFAIYVVVDVHNKADRFIYSISSNQKLLPLEQIEKKEVEEIFRKGHVGLFIEHFYQYDQWNYEKNIERSLWLIDDSGKQLYFFYKNEGHYNRLIQTTSSQSISNVEIQFDSNHNFGMTAEIEINKPEGEKPKRYALSAQGSIKKVSQNYPLNPYGFLITNFKEISKKEINL